MDRTTLLNDEFYRISTIFTLLNMSEYGRSITELCELLKIDKKVIYSDIASLLKNTKSDYVLQLDEELATEEQEELLDQLMLAKEENEELNKETIVSRLKTGAYDELPFIIPSPAGESRQGIAGISLTRSEFTMLSDFLKDLNRTVIGDRSDDHILFKGTTIFHTERERKLIDDLEEMIQKKMTAELTYRSRGGEETYYTVRPAKLVHSMPDDVYYLIAFVEWAGEQKKEELTNYMNLRVERIVDLQESLIRLPEPDLTVLPPFEKMWGMENGNEFHVKLRIYDEANVVYKVRRDLGERAEKLTKAEDGCYYYEDDLIGENRFRNWVRGYGSSVIVLEPENIREKMIETYQLLKEKYT